MSHSVAVFVRLVKIAIVSAMLAVTWHQGAPVFGLTSIKCTTISRFHLHQRDASFHYSLGIPEAQDNGGQVDQEQQQTFWGRATLTRSQQQHRRRRRRHQELFMKKRSSNDDEDDDETFDAKFDANFESSQVDDDEAEYGKLGKGFDGDGDDDDDDDDDEQQVYYGKFGNDEILYDENEEEDAPKTPRDPRISKFLYELVGDKEEELIGQGGANTGVGKANWNEPKYSSLPEYVDWKPPAQSNFFMDDFLVGGAGDGVSTTPSTATPSSSPELGSLQNRMVELQQQLDKITQLVQNGYDQTKLIPSTEQSYFLPSTPTKFIQQRPVVVTPVKTMLFIDGTWLYYSIYERDNQEHDGVVSRKFGKGWRNRYQVDWEALPRIIGQQLQTHCHRPVDLVRILVFTSYKASTSKSSYRFQMFQEMQRLANYDLHMMETVGKSEKCVDISLAVEMLHYATVANAFDVGILLSGDKDFMPAMIRTRQKGCQVALASMRSGCNRDLNTNSHAKDYPTIWIEDFLDAWIVPKLRIQPTRELPLPPHFDSIRSATAAAAATQSYRNPGGTKKPPSSLQSGVPTIQDVAFRRVIVDFIVGSEGSRVASRDIGRYLKLLLLPSSSSTVVGSQKPYSMLDAMKRQSGSLIQIFSQMDDMFLTEPQDDSHTFWVTLKMDPHAAKRMVMKAYEACASVASDVERAFFESYSLEILETNAAALYFHTYQDNPLLQAKAESSTRTPEASAVDGVAQETRRKELPGDLTKDYTLCTLAELRERCRERQLPLSGTKAVLLERIRQDVEKGIARIEEEYGATNAALSRQPTTATTITRSSNAELPRPYLARLIQEFLQTQGGYASSRQVGRYLAATRASPVGRKNRGDELSALQELKFEFGNLSSFVVVHSHLFVEQIEPALTSPSEFRIALREKAMQIP